MKRLIAAACLVAAVGLSGSSFAQYGGYGYRGAEEGYDGGRRGPRDQGGFDRGRPRGSFWGSCRDIDQRGPTLRAMCRTTDGDWVPARIDLERCGGRAIANRDGRLIC